MALAQIKTATPSFTVTELYDGLLDGSIDFILDVRNEDDYKRWRVEGLSTLETINIPYFNFLEEEDASLAQIPTDRDVYVVCAKEGSSEFIAELLRENGINASYLQGGIMEWGNLYDARTVVENEFGRIIQIARPARGDLSFVVISNGAAAVVDPLRHVTHYYNAIADAGAELTHIFDTHAHADHISGGPQMARETGAGYYMHPYDAIHPLDMLPATFTYTYLNDGDTFQIGAYQVKVIWFPGHTLGQVNYLFSDPNGARYLFTGDGIFLQSFGRPDLGGKGEAWTPILYDSMVNRLPPHLSDDTMILPAHFSLLDEGRDGVFAADWATVQKTNKALQPRTLDEFTDYVLGNLPVFPPEYVEIKRVNGGLVQPDEEAASELELGKNICALSD